MKLGPQRNYHEGRAALKHYANQLYSQATSLPQLEDTSLQYSVLGPALASTDCIPDTVRFSGHSLGSLGSMDPVLASSYTDQAFGHNVLQYSAPSQQPTQYQHNTNNLQVQLRIFSFLRYIEL